jgi:hypothetical protein
MNTVKTGLFGEAQMKTLLLNGFPNEPIDNSCGPTARASGGEM